MRRLIVLLLTLACFSTALPQAGAALWTGTCALSLRFNFPTPIRTVGTAPNYTITVGSVADLDPRGTGTQPCATSLNTLDFSRTTNVVASGSSTEWSCSAVVASGSWDQEWLDQSGEPSPPTMFDGTHTIDGTWGDWVLTIRDDEPNVVIGVAELTVASQDATKVTQCPLLGITSVTMVGTLVFQDP